MKKLFILVFLPLMLVLISPTNILAQTMMGSTLDDHTTREEAEGKEIWEKFQEKKVDCQELSDEDFGALGEYFMGQMLGEQHEAMNNMMIQMMEGEGEKQMHISMGRRISGCETDASMPQTMMSGNTNNVPIMWNWGQNPFVWFGFGSWLVILTLVVWLIVGVLAIIWFWKQLKKK